MVYELTSGNPLILLQSAKIAKLKGAYIQMDPIHNGRAAKDLMIALKNPSNNRLNLCMAKKVKMKEGELKAEQISLITSTPGSAIDHLIIENQERLISSAPELAQLLRKQGWKIANDHLKFSLLRVREKSLREAKEMRNLAKCHTEMARRLSLGIAALTFTFMGVSFGMEISRNRSRRGIISVLCLAAVTLITFFIGKELDHLVWVASSLFLLPHAGIIAFSLITLSRVNRGIE